MSGSELAPWVTLVVGLLAFTGVCLSLAQKSANDRRDAWWKRAQWAIDKGLSPDQTTREVGIDTMQVLALDQVPEGDLAILEPALDRIRLVDTPDDGPEA